MIEYVVLTKDFKNRLVEADSYKVTGNGYLVFERVIYEIVDGQPHMSKPKKTNYLAIAAGQWLKVAPRDHLEE